MKNYKNLSIFVLLVLCFTVGFSAAPVMERGFTDPAKTLIVSKDSPLVVIKLKSNPSTGYSWSLVQYDKKKLKFLGSKYFAPKMMIAGAPGFEVWRFKARPSFVHQPAQAQIILQYRRPWTKEEASEKTTFNIGSK